MFSVIAIGDAHFKRDWRQADRLASAWHIVNAHRSDARLGCWAVPGDLYDGVPDEDERIAWTDLLLAMAATAPVIICYGNHDRRGTLYQLGKLKAAYPIIVVDSATTFSIETAVATLSGGPWSESVRGPWRLTAFVLPYPHPPELVSAGVAPGDIGTEAAVALDAIFMDAAIKLDTARAHGAPTIFLGHVNVGGSVMSTGQPLIGHEIELDHGLLARLGDCPKILNHIHKPQEIAGAWFTGSIAAMSWGEREPKRYLEVVYQMADDGQWEWSVRSHPLPTAPLVLVEATFVMVDGQPEFGYDIAPVDVPDGADVRVRVRYPETEREFFARGKSAIKEAFSHARTCEIDPVCEPDRGMRAPAVTQATTLPAKVRAWAETLHVALPCDLDDALSKLEAVPAAEVIEEFRLSMRNVEDGRL